MFCNVSMILQFPLGPSCVVRFEAESLAGFAEVFVLEAHSGFSGASLLETYITPL
jgi:hypothetical protein